jgi:hypothetical protein
MKRVIEADLAGDDGLHGLKYFLLLLGSLNVIIRAAHGSGERTRTNITTSRYMRLSPG